MLDCKLIIKESRINDAGQGLFTTEPIKKGTVVMCFSLDAFVINERVYNKQQSSGNRLITQTGCRLADDLFVYTDNRCRLENYINHSFDANILYHCGLCIAKHDLTSDVELTVDYRYILSETDDESFIDAKTNMLVKGYDGHTALLKTTNELLQLLQDGTRIITYNV